MRPRQWSKNLLLFAGLLFAEKLGDTTRVWLNILAFLSFCLISGAVYIYNDLRDVEDTACTRRSDCAPSPPAGCPFRLRVGG